MTSVIGSPTQFLLPIALWRQMLAHVQACLPEEACGLIGSAQSPAGDPPANVPQALEPAPLAAAVLPIENELHSPVRFRMAPTEQLKAFYWLEERGLELSAIFHSHPRGPVHPSATDLAEFAYPGVLMLILSPLVPASSRENTPTQTIVPSVHSSANWQGRIYRIDDTLSSGLSASEIPLVLLPEPQRGKG